MPTRLSRKKARPSNFRGEGTSESPLVLLDLTFDGDFEDGGRVDNGERETTPPRMGSSASSIGGGAREKAEEGTSESPFVLLDFASDGDLEDSSVGGERETPSPRMGSSASSINGGALEKTEEGGDSSSPSSASAVQVDGPSSKHSVTPTKPWSNDTTSTGERRKRSVTQQGMIAEESSQRSVSRGRMGQTPVRDGSTEGRCQRRSLTTNAASGDSPRSKKKIASEGRGRGVVSPTVPLTNTRRIASLSEKSMKESQRVLEPDREGEHREGNSSAATESDTMMTVAPKCGTSPSRPIKARAVASAPTAAGEGDNNREGDSSAAATESDTTMTAAPKGGSFPTRPIKAREVASAPTLARCADNQNRGCEEAVQNDPPDAFVRKEVAPSQEQSKVFGASRKTLEENASVCSLVADEKTTRARVPSKRECKSVSASSGGNAVPFQFSKCRRLRGTKNWIEVDEDMPASQKKDEAGASQYELISLTDSDDDNEDNDAGAAVVTAAAAAKHAAEASSTSVRSASRAGSSSAAASTPSADRHSKFAKKNGGEIVASMVSPQEKVSHRRVDATCMASTGNVKEGCGLFDEKSQHSERGCGNPGAFEDAEGVLQKDEYKEQKGTSFSDGTSRQERTVHANAKEARCNDSSPTSAGQPTSEQGAVKHGNRMVESDGEPGVEQHRSPLFDSSPGGSAERAPGEVEEMTTTHKNCAATGKPKQQRDVDAMTARRRKRIGDPTTVAQKEGNLSEKPEIVDFANLDEDSETAGPSVGKRTTVGEEDAANVPTLHSFSEHQIDCEVIGDSDDSSIGSGLPGILAGSSSSEKEEASTSDAVSGRKDSSTASSSAPRADVASSSSASEIDIASSSSGLEVGNASSSPRTGSFSQVPEEFKWIQPQEKIVYTRDARPHSAIVLSAPTMQSGRWMVDVKWEIRGTIGNVDCSFCQQHASLCRQTKVTPDGQEIMRSVRNRFEPKRFGVYYEQKGARRNNEKHRKNKKEEESDERTMADLPEGQTSVSQTEKEKGKQTKREHSADVNAKQEFESSIKTKSDKEKRVHKRSKNGGGAWRDGGGNLVSISWSMKELPECDCELKCGGNECIQKPVVGRRKRKRVDMGVHVSSQVTLSNAVREENKGTKSEECRKSNNTSSSRDATNGSAHPSLKGAPRVEKVTDSIEHVISAAVSRIKPLEKSQKSAHSDSDGIGASFFVDEILRMKVLKHVKRLQKEIATLKEENAKLKRQSSTEANFDARSEVKSVESSAIATGGSTKMVPKEEEKDPDIVIVGITASTPDKDNAFRRHNEISLKKKKELVDAISTERGSKQSDPEGHGIVARRDIEKGEKFLDHSAVFCKGEPPSHFDKSRDYIKTTKGYFRLRESTTQWMNEARNGQVPNIRWGTHHDMEGPETTYVLTWTSTMSIKKDQELLTCYVHN